MSSLLPTGTTRVFGLRVDGAPWERSYPLIHEIFKELQGHGFVARAFLENEAVYMCYRFDDPQDNFSLEERIRKALRTVVHPTRDHLTLGSRGIKFGEVALLTGDLVPTPPAAGALLDLSGINPYMRVPDETVTWESSAPVEFIDRESPENWWRVNAEQSPDSVPPGLTAAEWAALTPEERNAWAR